MRKQKVAKFIEKCKISLILPSIKPETWFSLYNQIKMSVGNYSFELIAVGPNFPPKELENKSSFRFLRDYGCPSRCVQLASLIAEGKYITWLPDDCYLDPGGYAEAIARMDKLKYKDGMTILYSEGISFSGTQHFDAKYWDAGTHQDQQLRHINPKWGVAPIFMYNLNFFKEIGGLDCRFEHLNLNTHDLAFRAQKMGGVLHYSPRRVQAVNWKPWNGSKTPVQLAYEENDLPLFRELYNGEKSQINRKISLDNWQNADSIWKRRFTT